MQANMGMAGEFRVVVKRADGSTKIDTGYQKNLILNQGLDFFGGGNGTNMMNYCVIGSGNSQPNYTQNKLDTAVAGVAGAEYSTKYDYNASTDGNLYKTNRVRKYSFSGLNNTNISELGLASTYSNPTTYFLCTRALIKDSQGNPTTITVLSGEILEIYYKLWLVYNTADGLGKLNLLDGTGNITPFNFTVRLSRVGGIYFINNKNDVIGAPLNVIDNVGNQKTYITYSGDLADITSLPSSQIGMYINFDLSNYIINGFKRTIVFKADIGQSNGNIRSMGIYTSMGVYQIRFGSVADDSPITKTNTQTLSIPVEVSWGRYEGAL